jgi:hypothetical protein
MVIRSEQTSDKNIFNFTNRYITHFQYERTYQNGDYQQHPIALSAPHLKRCFM